MKKIYLLLFAVIFVASGLDAQISNLCFNASSGTYTPLASGTEVTTVEADDANATGILIGFNFNYLGTNFTTVSVNSNGYLSFNNIDPTNQGISANNIIATQNSTLLNALFPLWDDLDGTGGTATYLTSGVAGSQVFTMEWKNWQWASGAGSASISFQVKLYEGTNVIEFVYNQEAGSVQFNDGASIGLNDATGGLGHYLSLDGPGPTPTVSSTVPTDVILTRPATGQIYRFTPAGIPTVTGFNPDPACGTGTSVTITGTNFVPCLTGVSFNGTAATVYAYVNATTVTATIPAGATAGPVSVTTSGGTGTSAANLTISSAPSALTYSSNTPVYCTGTLITNNTPSSGGGAVVSYSVSPSLPAGLSIDLVTGIISGTPTTATGAANYTVTATNGCGFTTAIINITVSGTPAITGQPSTATQILCQNDAATSLSVTATGSGLTYQWYSNTNPSNSGGTSLGAGATSATYTPVTSVDGTLYYYCIVSGACSPAAVSNVSGDINVTPLPATVIVTGAGTFCNSTTITADNGADGTIYFQGTTSNGTSGALPSTSQLITTSGTYYFRAQSSAGCWGPEGSAVVTINVAPSTPVANPGSAATCTSFTANWATSAGATNYYLDVSTDNAFGSFVPGYQDLDAGNATTLNVTGLTAGTTYYYRVRAGNTCGTSVSSSVITYNTLLAPGVPVANPGTGASCSQITANWSPAANAITYYLDVSTDNAFGSFVPGYQNLNVGNVTTLNVTGLTVGTTYYYRVRAGNGCGITVSSSTINYTTLLAAIAVAGTDITTCSNSGAVNITAGSSAADYATITWTSSGSGTFANANSLTTATYNPSAADIAAGSVTLTLTATGNGTCADASSTKTLTITKLPVATFNYAGTPYCSNAANPSPTFSGGGVAGTFTSTGGLSINAATGQVNLAASTAGTYTVTNTIAAAAGCGAVVATSTITITALPVATFSYTGTPYCSNAANPSPTFSGGGVAGTFTSTGGLSINAATGQINLAASTAGTYTVTNTIAAANGCGAVVATSTITITALPVATFSYAGTPYCSNAANPSPTFSGGGVAGTFTSTGGLSINAATGQVNLAASTAGTYTVTNTIAAANGCGAVVATSTITITALQVATFSYTGSPYCNNAANPSPTFSGGGVAGTFTSTGGLSINAATGQVNLAASTAGTYTVTNTIAAAAGCGAVVATSTITITALPVATFSYTGTPYCSNAANPSPTFSGGGVAGTFTSTGGLSINAATGQVNLAASTAGTYTVTNTIAAAAGCGAVVATSTITITALPVATFSYAGTPYCSNAANPSPTFSGGGVAGTFTSTGGLSINAATGQVNLAASTAGTYTVTNTIAAANGCGAVVATSSITITALKVATFSYTASPYCSNAANPSPTFSGGGVAGTFTSTAGLSINAATGQVNLAASTAGTYTVTNTIAAAAGCGAVVATSTISITTLPVATFSYTGSPYCNNAANPSPTFSGGGVAGTFTSTGGLSINAATGQVNLAVSTAGTYTVTNTIAAAGGCGAVVATSTISITTLPVATFSYTGSPYCSNAANPSPTYSGGGVAGTFTSTAGLSINAATGQVNLAASTAGTYTVTNTIAAAAGCGAVVATSTITITKLPVATFSYTGTPYCNNAANPSPTFSGGGVAGTFTSTGGLSIDAATGQVNLVASTAGTYTVTNTIAAAGGCGAVVATSSITINTPPSVSGQPANQITCAGTGKTFSVTASGSSPTYQWQYSPNNVAWSNVANGTPANTNYNNSTTATLTVTPTAAAVAGIYYYRCVVSVTSCGSINSNSATLTVNINSTITLTSAASTNNQTVCQNSPITNITYAIGGGGTGASIPPGSLPAGVTGVYSAGVFTISGTPTATGTFNYTITTSGPCTQATASGSILVNAIPVGTFSATENSGLTPNDNIICAGDNVTFTAPSGYGSYTFKVNGSTVQGPGLLNTYSTSSLTTGQSVTVDVANALNCGTTFGPIVITVNPLPTPTLTITESSGTAANDNTICPNASVTLTATSPGATVYSFLVNGSIAATGPSNTYTTTSISSTSTVGVIANNSSGCQDTSALQTITVNALPSGSLSASSNTICAGDNVTFTATAGAGNTYNFKVNGGTVQNTTANIYSTNTLTNGQVVTVDVTNGSGCSAAYLPQQVITVNPLPTGTLTASENSGTPNDNSICANEPVTFTFSNNAYSNYKFFVNGGAPVQNGGSNSYINSTLQPGDVVTVQVSAGTCTATFTAPAITIVPSPTGSLAVSPSNTICAGDMVVFTATSAGVGNTYNFLVQGNPEQNGASNTYSTTSLANGDVVSVEVTNTNSCVTTLNTITMVVSPLPTGTMQIAENSGTPNDKIICAGTSVVFTAPAGFSNYDFLLNGVSVQSSTTLSTYTTSSLVDQDRVTVAVKSGNCIGLLNEDTITVNPLPVVAAITGPNNVCVNATITLSDTPTGGVWTSEDPSTATIDPSTGVVTGVNPGPVTIDYTYTNGNACSNTVTKAITVNPLPTVAPITGNTNVCTSTDSQLADVTPGGTWDTDNPTVATVDATGLVSGVSPGTANITYTVTNANLCETIVTAVVTVTTLPTVAAITTTAPAGFNVCIGSTIPLKDATSGGVWSSDDGSIATINSSGVVTGIGNGSTTIRYTITTTCSETVEATQVITVNTPPSGTIAYTGGPFCKTSGPITVNQTGTAGGTYSASPGGLIINAADGTITPSSSTGGTYTVTYTISASGGCGIFTTTTSVTITTAPSATISYAGGPFCTTSAPVNVARVGTAGGTYSSTAGLVINAGTGRITPAGSTGGTYTVTYTIAASGGCAVFTTTTSVTITAAPAATISYTGSPFCKTSGPVNVARVGTAGGTYSSTAGLTIDAAGTITPSSSTAGIYTVTYTIAASGGCAVFTTTTSVTITAAPTAIAGNDTTTCSNTGTMSITPGSSATNQSSVAWSSSGSAGTIGNANSLTTATYTPSAADIAAGSVILTLTANGNGNCAAAISTKKVTISTPPSAFILTPASASICTGDVQPLSASANTPSPGSVTFSSPANLNLAIPDDNNTGAVSTLAISGIPAGAIINSVSVTFNITHGYDGDLNLNIKAPNGNRLNLVNKKGGSGNNFTNTIISSATVTPINGSAPFTGTFAADAANNVGAAGNSSNVFAFSSLYSTPNGNWSFSAEDAEGCEAFNRFGVCIDGPYAGTLNNWSITINYTSPTSPLAVTWSPITNLYTDPGAVNAYVAGSASSTVYVKSNTSVTTTYTATETVGTCSTTKTVQVIVNPKPVVTITAIYCAPAPPGKVRLTANSVPAASSYLWSTGATTQTIDVDIAGTFTVTAFGAGSCPGQATINVATELVDNGDFEAGNTGFTSDYLFIPDGPGNNELVDDSGNHGYSITTDGQNVHNNFWGQDHTTRSGNFMAVNGHGNTLVVWKETVNVLPNTTYYFSAWAMSLNNVGPFAQLQFSVNGTLVGTAPVLPAGVNNNNNGFTGTAVWTRFYGTWTSGPATTSAVIYINDLQAALGGNDFGLDDISFGTLSTFITLESAPGTDAQTVCVNQPLGDSIVYNVGNGNASGPTVTGLPAGVTSVFGGDQLIISGTPTAVGNYTYTITTAGCNPYSVTGTITVQGQKVTLSSGTASPTVCVNTAITNIVYTLSGTATGASVTGLPANLTGTLSGTTFTISGTPVAAGSYPYTITTTGTCNPITVGGTITVQSQTITLNSGNDVQTVCINLPIANIQYTIGGSGNNASVSGLPPGVTGVYSGGVFIISGSPSSAAGSPYTYTVTTAGTSCAPVSITGTITVTPAPTMSLSSGTNPLTTCKGVPITNITYTVNGATGAGATGLPTGVTGGYSAGVFTISGTPTATGTFNYTITTTGGCGSATANGTIVVQGQTVTLTSGSANPSLCANTVMTNIVYTIGGTATSATVTGLPTGVSFAISGNIVTISGSPSVSGPFPYTVTTSGPSCAAATANGTITVTAAPPGGTLANVLVCSGSSGNITVSGTLPGTIQRWESSSNGLPPWTPIANTTITQSYTNITQPISYRVIVGSSGCNSTMSNVDTISIHNLWTGVTSTDWNTASNWSGNVLPSISCPNVDIPAGTPNQPILSNAPVATINNIHIFPGATLVVNGTGILQIAGTITNAGTFDASNGTIELNGSVAQGIAAGTFMNNAVHDLVITNASATGVTLNGALDVYGSLTYGVTGAKLNTNDHLTLKSTITETASLGDMTNHTITGNVTVERYIATGAHPKSWQLLAVPTQGQTIKASWQEGATISNVAPPIPTPGSAGNPVGGYGTMLTSDLPNALALGFDAYTLPGPSIKTYVSATDTYIGPSSTANSIYDQKGYFILVRGDRSVYTSGGLANPTILRTKGTLFTPANPPPVSNVVAGTFESIGNPYASALDLRNITKTGGADQFFVVWDPKLGGAYGLGGFVYLSLSGGNYISTPQSPTYPAGPRNFIQSGQAFLVQATGSNGTVSFKESDKASGSSLVNRPMRDVGLQGELRTNLYGVNSDGSTFIADGTLIQYDDTYSNSIDGLDGRKMRNTSENLAIKTAGHLLTIERRHTITQEDTIFLNLTGVRVQAYHFEFIASNLTTGLQGYLEDNYLHTRTQFNINGTTVANFTIENITGSYASDRFRIVFAPAVALPVTFTSVKAYRVDKNINVEWRVENEKNIKQYEVEKSTDGSQFTTMAIVAATGNGRPSAIYVAIDANPVEGYNYYRVKSIDINGKTAYTDVVKVLVGSLKHDITIYPNPITDGMIHLQFLNQPEGKYGIRLLNKLGQVIMARQISHAEGSSTELIKWDYNLAHGMYQLEVTKPDGGIKDINVLY